MSRLYSAWWRIRFFFFDGPLASCRIDRAFGWPWWRAIFRCWLPGKKLCYPPDVRKRMQEEREGAAS